MSKFLKTAYQKLEPYTPGEQPRDQVYIKLNTNESPYPPAPSVIRRIGEREIADLRLYSDPTAKALKEALAGLYGVESENIFLSNGSDDILNFAFMAYGEKGALFPDITYGFYPVFADLNGVEYEELPLRVDFTVDEKGYLCRDKLICIANPNAPTGIELSLEKIEEILKSNPEGVVVVDEAYVDFGGQTALPLISKYENLLVVRTFSKSRCMAGARLGYAIGPKGLIEDLERIKFSTNPYNINRLTMRLGEATVQAEQYYKERCADIIAAREWTRGALLELGFEVLPSKANFLFAKSDRIGGEALYLKLKERGILVRHFKKERICDFNRITIGTMAQMERLIAVLKEELK